MEPQELQDYELKNCSKYMSAGHQHNPEIHGLTVKERKELENKVKQLGDSKFLKITQGARPMSLVCFKDGGTHYLLGYDKVPTISECKHEYHAFPFLVADTVSKRIKTDKPTNYTEKDLALAEINPHLLEEVIKELEGENLDEIDAREWISLACYVTTGLLPDKDSLKSDYIFKGRTQRKESANRDQIIAAEIKRLAEERYKDTAPMFPIFKTAQIPPPFRDPKGGF